MLTFCSGCPTGIKVALTTANNKENSSPKLRSRSQELQVTSNHVCWLLFTVHPRK